MDIITHTLSGLAAGSVAAGFSSKGPVGHVGVVALSGLGGALPDIDAVSLWSGFDATIGRFMHLAHSGAEVYSGTLWYSHHGFFHSLAAALLFAAIIGAAGWLFGALTRKRGFKESVGKQTAALAGFVSGFVLHLLQDMATPASTWGGVRIFWPLKSYVGGSGEIWWWNNYDLFLIAAGVFLATTTLLFLKKRSVRFETKYLIAALFAFGCIVSLSQIHARDHDYAYTGNTARYAEFEEASKRQQRDILGDRLYGAMEWLDKRLPVHF